jgi:hypothetical protein
VKSYQYDGGISPGGWIGYTSGGHRTSTNSANGTPSRSIRSRA